MSASEFGKELKDKINNYASDINAEAPWDDLQPLEDKEDRKFFWVFFGMVSLLLSLGRIYAISFSSNSMEPQVSKHNESILENNIVIQEASQSKIPQILSEAPFAEANDQNLKINSTEINNSPNLVTDLIQSQMNSPQELNGLTATNKSTKNEKTLDHGEQNALKALRDLNPNAKQAFDKDVTLDASEENATQAKLMIDFALLHRVNFSPTFKQDQVVLFTNDLSIEDFKMGKNKKEKVEGAWSVWVSFTPEISYKFMANTNGRELDDYIAERKKVESSFFAFRSGVGVRHASKNGMRFSAGFEYGQMTEIFQDSVDLGSELFFDLDAPAKFVREEDETLSPISGGRWRVIQTIQYRKIFNRYKSYDIPVSIGYGFQNDKFGLHVDVGAILNLRLKARGQIYDRMNPEDEARSIINLADKDGVIENNIGLNLFASAAINYHISPAVTFELGPQFRYGLNSFTTESFGVQTRYHQLGLKTIISYTF